jgi:hypothetical protein
MKTTTTWISCFLFRTTLFLKPLPILPLHVLFTIPFHSFIIHIHSFIHILLIISSFIHLIAVDDDDVSPRHKKQREKPDMSVFRDAVQDCLFHQPSNPNPNPNPKSITKPPSNDDIDKFSGLRIRLLTYLLTSLLQSQKIITYSTVYNHILLLFQEPMFIPCWI